MASRAILLAAGQGTRLRPLTDSVPKCMVEYQGRQIIDYILHALTKAGVTEIIAVKGYLSDVLQKPSITRSYVNERFMTTNMVGTLFSSREEMDGSKDIIISYTDIAYGYKTVETLLKSDAPFSVIVDSKWRELWEGRMEDPLTDAETMKIDENGLIKELGKKPKSYDEIQGQYIGLMKISKDYVKKMVEFYDSLDKTAIYDGKDFDNMYMTSFIQLIIDNNVIPVHAVRIDGGWTEVDTPTDLDFKLDTSNFDL
eukprot:TRINITY_DN1849_c0_g1_i1.p1 TRINITY_DN1849_c0_g1~~TRINITY_DN1849_c0_g1_i1.p1  ORF type:complete len:255 (-),score=57.33 TRINITY_DN1849_c0_g1_i1:221-985(-)